MKTLVIATSTAIFLAGAAAAGSLPTAASERTTLAFGPSVVCEVNGIQLIANSDTECRAANGQTVMLMGGLPEIIET